MSLQDKLREGIRKQQEAAKEKPLARPKPILNYVPRRGDYGDDISDYEAKERLIWSKETTNFDNPRK